MNELFLFHLAHLTDNGDCDINANCKYIGPGQRYCKCKDDYFGNGFNCQGIISGFIALLGIANCNVVKVQPSVQPTILLLQAPLPS